MDELETRKQMVLQAMNVEHLPAVPEERLQLSTCQKYSIADLSALGVAFQPLVTVVQTVTGASGAGMSGIYHVNTKGLQMMQFKNGTGFMGALATEAGTVGGGQAIMTSLICDPTMLFMAAALMNVEKKLDAITEMQQEMMDFLNAKEKAKLRGDLNTLTDVLNNYKFNWNNEKYKTNKHILVQDIRKDSDQGILLFRDQIKKKLARKGLIYSDQEVKSMLQKLQGEFRDYQLSLYLYSFSTFLEVMLLENFDPNYLASVSQRIEDYSFQYRELYTDCFNRITQISEKSVQSVLAKGLACISKGAGEVIAKIPVANKGPVDEALISAGSTLEKLAGQKTDKAMQLLITTSANCTVPFVDNIKTVSRIFNLPLEVLFDKENLYFIGKL